MSSTDSGSSSFKRVPRPDIALVRFLLMALLYDSRVSRFVRGPIWNAFYSMSRRDERGADLMTFLNMGYLPDLSELGAEDTADIVDRVSELLYDQVVGDVDLTGQTAVEVGCGPGAGSAHVARTYRPASLLGVDINEEMITWCREHHNAANLQFLQGDAQNLPITSNSVDTVINVESSHCYPSRSRFFEEVMRVLRPGGSFLFADAIWSGRKKREASDVVSAQLSEAGLIIEERIDITENVLAAREAVSRSSAFRSRMRESARPLMRPLVLPLVEEFLCLPGTKFYTRMASREMRYLQWRALKPSENLTTAGVTEVGMVSAEAR